MNIDVFYSRKTDNWKTPKSIYDKLMNDGYYDPCPFLSEFDGLKIDWKAKNFVNPPYSKLKIWVHKSIEQSKLNKEVLLLIPARTDTQAFKQLYEYGAHFIFITGRLKFNDSGVAPFPSMFVKLVGGGAINI